MRLWHEELIECLPRQQLLGQHRECCALRGNGWGKPHSTVNYVFKYKRERLVAYHQLIIQEMLNRGYNPNQFWTNYSYRGKTAKRDTNTNIGMVDYLINRKENIYKEHNLKYLEECIDNLTEKGGVCKYYEKVIYSIKYK